MKIPLTVLSSRATPITSNDKSESVTLATWILMGVFVVMFLAREAIKTVVFKKLALDDLFILLATIFGIALSVTTIVLAAEGLGVLGVLTLKRANTLMKGLYASDFLYVLSICFAKLSLVTFFYGVLVQGTHRRFVLGFGAFIFIWSLASIGAIAFQCGLPKPWEILSLHCYDRGAFWVAYCIIDMTTDVSIIMLSVNLVAYLRVKLSRKIAVVACFAPRVLVMVASLVRLIYLYPVNPHRNPEFKLWGPVICTQVQVCLSISTACIPYMVPFFKSLESGVWRVRSVRSRDVRISDLYGWGTSRKSGRGMKKAKQLGSVESTAFANWNNDRTADASPRIPSPRPLSPLTPSRIITPPNTSHGSSRSPSERRLRLHIPPPPALAHRAAEDALSPQTASSHALSPQCLSPQAFLSPTIASPIRREPMSPQRSYSPKPQSPGAYYKPADLPTPSPARAAPRFSLFPIPPTTRYTPLVAQPPCPLVSFRKASKPEKQIQNRTFLPQASSNISVQHEPPSNAEYPPRKSSLRRDTSVVAHNASCSPASIPSYYQRNTKTPPTAHTSASSNPQVPSYYYNTAPITSPPDSALPQPPSPQRVRNHRVLQPQNSSRRDQISPVGPASPRTPLNFWREEQVFHSANMSAGASTGPIPLQRPWTNEPMPVIQDKRNSPRIIVQKPS